jgi:Na+-translocating ferredoxin:NAD+ oxidoreductase RnfG subunit
MATIKLLLKWFYGIGFMISGLGLMFSTSFVGGLLFIIGGLVLLPPTLKMIEEKIGNPLPRPVKYLTVIGTIFVGVIFIANNHVEKEADTKKKEQEAFEKLPQHAKDSINLAKAHQDSLDNIQREVERLANEQKNRKEKVEKQFSSWDGSHPGLTRLIKKSMNDPDSYEHVETRFRDDDNSILVITEFRGKNAFGGKVKNIVSARVDFEGNVIEVISQN